MAQLQWFLGHVPFPQIDAVLGDRKPSFEDWRELRYTTRVINEAMRLYPQPPVLIRCAWVVGEWVGQARVSPRYLLLTIRARWLGGNAGSGLFLSTGPSLWGLYSSPCSYSSLLHPPTCSFRLRHSRTHHPALLILTMPSPPSHLLLQARAGRRRAGRLQGAQGLRHLHLHLEPAPVRMTSFGHSDDNECICGTLLHVRACC